METKRRRVQREMEDRMQSIKEKELLCVVLEKEEERIVVLGNLYKEQLENDICIMSLNK